MATGKCPLCESPCVVKIITTKDARWCEVDVCKMCGTMYPRDKPPGKKAKTGKKKTAKK